MSYLGLIRPIFRSFVKKFDAPNILEIGIDRGQSAIPIINNLSLCFKNFTYTGIDIKIKGCFFEQLSQLETISLIDIKDKPSGRDIRLFQKNSLAWLKNNVDLNIKFDLVFLDGDHNYFTVLNELILLQSYIHDNSVIICDDYNGKYSKSDMFYCTYEGYENNKLATPKIESERQGVKTAVDDFVTSSKTNFKSIIFGKLDPCIIFNKDKLEITTKEMPESGNMRDLKLYVDFL